MLFETIIIVVALIALLAGSYTDFRTREVPDWMNYGLIFAALGIRLIFSVVMNDFGIFLSGILGLVVLSAIAFAMYYAGQWGGGDSKMLMGLGALLGMELEIFPFIFHLVINILLVGAIYGLLWSVGLAIMKWKEFSSQYSVQLKKYIIWRRIAMIAALVFMATAFFMPLRIKIMLIVLSFATLLTFFVIVFIKSIEKACMIRKVSAEKLTIGDWISEDVFVKDKINPYDALYKRHSEMAEQEYKSSPIAHAKQFMKEMFGYNYKKDLSKKVDKKVNQEIKKIAKDVGMTYAEAKKQLKKGKISESILKKYKLYYDKRYVTGPESLGIEEFQIDELRKKKISVVIREGIPFVPSFLAAYLVTLYLQNNILFMLL